MLRRRSIVPLWIGWCLARTLCAAPAELKVQLGHSSTVESVAFSPDGRWVLTSSLDGTARIWDTGTGREIRRFGAGGDLPAVRETEHQIYQAVFSTDGKSVLTGGSYDNAARLWDIETGREIRRLKGHSSTVYAVAFSPDGRWVLTGSADKTARLWDLSTANEIRSFSGHTKAVYAVAFSPDARWIITGSSDRTARLWDVATGQVIRELPAHGDAVSSVAVSPDGRLALTGSRDGMVHLWDVASGQEIRRFRHAAADRPGRAVACPSWDCMTAVAFSPDGRLVLSGNENRAARIWDAASGREIAKFAGHSGRVTSVAFAPNGHSIVTGSDDHSALLWDVGAVRVVRGFKGEAYGTAALSGSRDGRFILAGNPTRLWDLAAGRETLRFPTGRYPVLSPDSRHLVTGDEDRIPRLFETDTGTEIRRFVGHTGAVRSVAFSPDGYSVATGSVDKTARVWDIESGRELSRFTGHNGEIVSVSFSPDGRSVLTASTDKTARLWEVATGREIRRLEGHTRELKAADFSPDGRHVVTVSWGDSTVRLWDPGTGEEVHRFSMYGALCARFSQDSRQLVSGGWGDAQLADVASGRSMRVFRAPSASAEHVAFDSTGRTLLSGGLDNAVRLWDTVTAKQIRQFEGHSGPTYVAFASGDRHILTGDDGAVRMWRADTGRLIATLVSFRDGGWAVVDPEGRYDASDPENASGLYWQLGYEVIDLRQLKSRFYTPNLLGRTLGFVSEPLPDVADLRNVQLWPGVQVEAPPDGQYGAATIRLSDRGGGIGRTVVRVNGRDLSPAAQASGGASGTAIHVDLKSAELSADGRNQIEVIAYDRANLVAGRGVTVLWKTVPANAGDPPVLHAIVAGVSTYGLPSMSLRFPAKDALDMAHALEVGGKRLFGAERVDIATFATGTPNEPTKANLRRAFESIASKARPNDVLLVYLAGHGVAGKPGSDLYYYLARDARSLTPEADSALWDQTTISSAELREWLGRKGMPLRQVIVLDTCAAGAANAQLLKLTDRRELTADQRRALELLKDATGSHILMGSAADKASYEASRYGQGLLTYSLLLGMRGEALDEGGRLDLGRWFHVAQLRVPEFARGIGGIQQPVISSPGGQTFPIALFTPEDRKQIPLATLKPQLLRASVHDTDDNDPLLLDGPVRERLRGISAPIARGDSRQEPPLVYLDQVAGDVDDAYIPQVRYEVRGAMVEVRLRLVSMAQNRVERRFETATDDTAELARRIVDGFIEMLGSIKPK